MEAVTAKKKINDEDVVLTIDVDLGDDLGDAIDKFGEDVVYSGFAANAKITCQAAMRREMGTGKTEDQIRERMGEWKPGIKLARVAVDPIQAFKAKLALMDDEERMEALSELGLV